MSKNCSCIKVQIFDKKLFESLDQFQVDNEKTDIINVVYPCGLRNAHAQWKLDLISRCNGETVKTWKVEFTTEKM